MVKRGRGIMKTTDELIQEQMSKRGYVAPFHKFLAREDPEYFELYMNYANVLLEKRQYALSRKMRVLLIIALDAARLFEFGLELYIQRALEEGIATKQEILETLEIAGIPTGFVTSAFGLGVLERVLKKLSTKPTNDTPNPLRSDSK